jgi:uncharacterized protein DUF4824
MKKYGLISAIVLIILTNVVVLAGVAYNRSGDPDATITLTERELHWQDNWNWMDREDSGLYLILKWNRPDYRVHNWEYWRVHNWEYWEDTWLNKKKLGELGFDTNYPLDDKKASRYYSRQLPRQAYVVLEFDGDSYQDWLKGTQKHIEEVRKEWVEEKNPDKKSNLESNIRQIEQLMITQSHLFAIDAGIDPKRLRKQYADPSKYIITPAVFGISMQYTSRKKDQPKSGSKQYLRGWVRKILISEIHVASDYRSFFISDIKTHTQTYLPKNKSLSDLEPRYQVTLNYGKRHEPWIVDVKKLQ